jgi:hypothetical protein
MALQKTHTSPSGADGNYWRIMQINIEHNAETVYCNLCLFKDSTASDNDKNPLDNIDFEWDQTVFDSHFDAGALDVVNQNPQERAYEYIKTLTDPVDFTTGTTDV